MASVGHDHNNLLCTSVFQCAALAHESGSNYIIGFSISDLSKGEVPLKCCVDQRVISSTDHSSSMDILDSSFSLVTKLSFDLTL